MIYLIVILSLVSLALGIIIKKKFSYRFSLKTKTTLVDKLLRINKIFQVNYLKWKINLKLLEI